MYGFGKSASAWQFLNSFLPSIPAECYEKLSLGSGLLLFRLKTFLKTGEFLQLKTWDKLPFYSLVIFTTNEHTHLIFCGWNSMAYCLHLSCLFPLQINSKHFHNNWAHYTFNWKLTLATLPRAIPFKKSRFVFYHKRKLQPIFTTNDHTYLFPSFNILYLK